MIKPFGSWQANDSKPLNEAAGMINDILRPIAVFRKNGSLHSANSGKALPYDTENKENNGSPLIAYAGAIGPDKLGDAEFKQAHRTDYPYIIGAMANGITSVDMVIEAANAGLLAFFGAGGLSVDAVNSAIDKIRESVGNRPFGFNLIHSPGDPLHEQAIVDLYLSKNLNTVSAAAYMRLNDPLILYRLKGIHKNKNGDIICPNKIIAKVSRIEVARQFFSPPPEKIVKRLLNQGKITVEEAELSKQIPVADDLTAEADSGGHTDNRPALALLPAILALRDRMMAKWDYRTQIRVGLAGGISTPESAAAAFAMGAAYILTGSVNQSCIEAGTSNAVKALLAKTEQADVIMAPAADMFEMGVKVQVLKRGTMFPLKGAKLYEYYRNYDGLETLSPPIRKDLEDKFFGQSLDEAWQKTEAFFRKKDPGQIERAASDPKHKMALLFRSYLGQASLWAIQGLPERAIDYQIWCGPAMGAFNEWVKGSFLEMPENRRVKTIALNLLVGACVILRASCLRQQGITLPPGAGRFSPLGPDDLEKFLQL